VTRTIAPARELLDQALADLVDAARKIGAIIELQCETAPVAKNEMFVNLAAAFAIRAVDGENIHTALLHRT